MISTEAADVESYDDDGLTTNDTYYYWLSATNASGDALLKPETPANNNAAHIATSFLISRSF